MRKRRALGTAAVGVLAGAIAGIVAGAGARVAMRMVAMGVADGVGVLPEFTIEGTAAILIFGAIAGAAFGLLYIVVVDRLPVPRRLAGLTFGLVLLTAIGPFFLTTEEFFSWGRVVMFAVLFPAFGLALGLATVPTRAIVERLSGPTDDALDLSFITRGMTWTRAGAGVLAGMVAGIGAGIGARLAMRMVADGLVGGAAGPTTFTVEGTTGILVAGALVGAPAGVLYEAIADRLPGPRIARGLVFTVAPFGLIVLLALRASDAVLLITTPALFLIALPFVVYGVALGVLRSPSERIVSGARLALRRVAGVQSR